MVFWVLALRSQKRGFSILDIAMRDIVTCREDDPIPRVAQLMVDNWVSSVFVVNDDDKVVGIITDGAIFRLIAKEEDPRQYKAKDIMFRDILTVNEDASIDEIKGLFEKTKIKRVGVVDKSGKLVGVISKKWIDGFRRYARYYNIELRPVSPEARSETY